MYSTPIIKCLVIACFFNIFLTKLVIAQEIKSEIQPPFTNVAKQKKVNEIIVITGTRTPKLLSNSPVQIDVIDEEQINLLTQGTIAQALNFMPGVVVTRNTKDGYNVQMQGFDGDNVLILLNSQPLISPTGAAVDLDQISAQDIKQIEIIHGAASVMYGSSAMGGVINIITHSSNENQLNVSYEIGSYAQNALDDDLYSHQGNLSATLLTDNWRHQVNVLLKHAPGFDYDEDNSSTPAGSLDKTFINLASSGELGTVDTAIKYQFFDESKDKNTGRIAGQSTLEHYISDVKQHQIDIDFSQKLSRAKDKVQHQWQVNSRMMKHKETSGRSASLRDADIGLYEINAKYIWSRKNFESVSGALIHQDTLKQTKVDDGAEEVPYVTKESIEAFGQLNWINKHSQYLLGLRVQNDSSFGFHSALRLSGMNDLLTGDTKLKVRYGIGQGYRVPTLKERFYEFDHSALGYKVYGNEDLSPETSITANTSLSFEKIIDNSVLGSFDLTSNINLFYTQAKDLVDTVANTELSIIESLDISVYTNIDEAILKGFDWSVGANYSQWTSQLNYSYLSAESIDGDRLQGRPTHQVKASIGYSPAHYNINSMLYVVYQKDEAVPIEGYENGTLNNSWYTVDFKLNQQLTKHFSWRLTLENILDQHQDINAVREQRFDARPISSRFVSFGVTYTL